MQSDDDAVGIRHIDVGAKVTLRRGAVVHRQVVEPPNPFCQFTGIPDRKSENGKLPKSARPCMVQVQPESEPTVVAENNANNLVLFLKIQHRNTAENADVPISTRPWVSNG